MVTNQQIKQLLAEINAAKSHLNAAYSLLVTIKQQEDIIIDMARVYPSRPMSKGELAAMLGKSTRHLSRWLKPFRKELRKMNVSDHAKMLPAEAVYLICSTLDITFPKKMTEKTDKSRHEYENRHETDTV